MPPALLAGRHFHFQIMTPSHSDPARWTKGAERLLAATRILDLHSMHYRHPVRQTERDFVVIAAPDWVNVVALTTDGHLVLVRQFRFGINDFSLEIPGGVIEAGEDPVAAGLRELAEETGFVGTSARLLGSVHPNPAIQNNRCHLVLVEAAARTASIDWDPDEEIAVTTAPVADVLAAARDGRITHSLVLCGLFLFESWWRRPVI
jgi:ADP-ribose pyrophosphatase